MKKSLVKTLNEDAIFELAKSNGVQYFEGAQFSKALKVLATAADIKDDVVVLMLLAECHEKLNHPIDALIHLKKAYKLDSDQPAALISICRIYWKLPGDKFQLNEAKEWYSMAVKQKLENKDVKRLQVRLLFQTKTLDDILVITMNTLEKITSSGTLFCIALFDYLHREERHEEAFNLAYDIQFSSVWRTLLHMAGWYKAIWSSLLSYGLVNTVSAGWRFRLLWTICLDQLIYDCLNNENLAMAAQLILEFDDGLQTALAQRHEMNVKTYLMDSFLQNCKGQLALHCCCFLIMQWQSTRSQMHHDWLKLMRDALPFALIGYHTQKLAQFKAHGSREKRIEEFWLEQITLRAAQLGRFLLSCISKTKRLSNTNNKFLWSSVENFMSDIKATTNQTANWRSRSIELLRKVSDTNSIGKSLISDETFFALSDVMPQQSDVEYFEKRALLEASKSLPQMIYYNLSKSNLLDIHSESFYDLPLISDDVDLCKPSSLDQFDVDTFVYAACLQAQREIAVSFLDDSQNNCLDMTNGRPPIFPFVCLQKNLCNEEQIFWWSIVCDISNKQKSVYCCTENEIRVLVRGLEVVRGVKEPSMEIIVALKLGRTLWQRFVTLECDNHKDLLEERIYNLNRCAFAMIQNRINNLSEQKPKYFQYAMPNALDVQLDIMAIAEEAAHFIGNYDGLATEYSELLKKFRLCIENTDDLDTITDGGETINGCNYNDNEGASNAIKSKPNEQTSQKLSIVFSDEDEETELLRLPATLLRYDQRERAWIERFVGQVKLIQNNQNTNCYRIVMRRAGKLWCNQRINAEFQMKYIHGSQIAITWTKDFQIENEKLDYFAIRFKTSRLCKIFLNVVIKYQRILDSSRNVGKTAPKMKSKKQLAFDLNSLHKDNARRSSYIKITKPNEESAENCEKKGILKSAVKTEEMCIVDINSEQWNKKKRSTLIYDQRRFGVHETNTNKGSVLQIKINDNLDANKSKLQKKASVEKREDKQSMQWKKSKRATLAYDQRRYGLSYEDNSLNGKPKLEAQCASPKNVGIANNIVDEKSSKHCKNVVIGKGFYNLYILKRWRKIGKKNYKMHHKQILMDTVSEESQIDATPVQQENIIAKEKPSKYGLHNKCAAVAKNIIPNKPVVKRKLFENVESNAKRYSREKHSETIEAVDTDTKCDYNYWQNYCSNLLTDVQKTRVAFHSVYSHYPELPYISENSDLSYKSDSIKTNANKLADHIAETKPKTGSTTLVTSKNQRKEVPVKTVLHSKTSSNSANKINIKSNRGTSVNNTIERKAITRETDVLSKPASLEKIAPKENIRRNSAISTRNTFNRKPAAEETEALSKLISFVDSARNVKNRTDRETSADNSIDNKPTSGEKEITSKQTNFESNATEINKRTDCRTIATNGIHNKPTTKETGISFKQKSFEKTATKINKAMDCRTTANNIIDRQPTSRETGIPSKPTNFVRSATKINNRTDTGTTAYNSSHNKPTNGATGALSKLTPFKNCANKVKSRVDCGIITRNTIDSKPTSRETGIPSKPTNFVRSATKINNRTNIGTTAHNSSHNKPTNGETGIPSKPKSFERNATQISNRINRGTLNQNIVHSKTTTAKTEVLSKPISFNRNATKIDNRTDSRTSAHSTILKKPTTEKMGTPSKPINFAKSTAKRNIRTNGGPSAESTIQDKAVGNLDTRKTAAKDTNALRKSKSLADFGSKTQQIKSNRSMQSKDSSRSENAFVSTHFFQTRSKTFLDKGMHQKSGINQIQGFGLLNYSNANKNNSGRAGATSRPI